VLGCRVAAHGRHAREEAYIQRFRNDIEITNQRCEGEDMDWVGSEKVCGRVLQVRIPLDAPAGQKGRRDPPPPSTMVHNLLRTSTYEDSLRLTGRRTGHGAEIDDARPWGVLEQR
jgi:hypothetical protein